jgi:integrase
LSKKRGNGEGSLTKRKDGRWMARYTVHTLKGPKRKVLYGSTRKEAAERLAKALSDGAAGIVYDDESMTLGEFLDRWLKDCVRGSVRESTFDRDSYLVNNHMKPALGKRRLKKLAPLDVQSFYRDALDAGLSPSTVNKIHTVLHKALSQAVSWALIPRNVTEAVKAPSADPGQILGYELR